MSLISLNADLNRTAAALERIANCLEQLLPPVYPQKGATAPEEHKIELASNEATFEHELEDQLEFFKDKWEMINKQVREELDEQASQR